MSRPLAYLTIGAFTPQYFSHKGSSELFSSHELTTDRVHTGISPWGRIKQMKPLTALLLLLLWVYSQAARPPTSRRILPPEVPGVGDWLQ